MGSDAYTVVTEAGINSGIRYEWTFGTHGVAIDTTKETFQIAAVTSGEPFKVAYEGVHSKLEVRSGIHGKLEVRFTLNGDYKNLDSACAEINKAMESAHYYPKEGYKVYLSGNNYPHLSKDQDIVITFTPVVRDSGGRTRHGYDPETSHEALLNKLELGFVPNDIFRLACGAYRANAGFPENPALIGTYKDSGDLAEGKSVRTEKGARSSTVMSYHYGVDNDVFAVDIADAGVVVAGAALSE